MHFSAVGEGKPGVRAMGVSWLGLGPFLPLLPLSSALSLRRVHVFDHRVISFLSSNDVLPLNKHNQKKQERARQGVRSGDSSDRPGQHAHWEFSHFPPRAVCRLPEELTSCSPGPEDFKAP